MTSLEGCTKRSGCNPGHSPGLQRAGQLSGRQYLDVSLWMVRYCLTGSCLAPLFRGLRPRFFDLKQIQHASLSTAFQAGRDMFFIVFTYQSLDNKLH